MPESRTRITIFILALLAAGGLYLIGRPGVFRAPAPLDEVFEVQNSAQSGIDITAQPVIQNGEMEIQLGLDTHSGSLDWDLVRTASLRDASGRTYSPLAWNGTPPGGHHRNGVLHFGAILISKPFSLTLAPQDAPTWQFQWQ